jgi:hypothetical protein
MPMKKSKIPELRAGIKAASGVLQRGGAGGAMSLIGVMPCDADEEVEDPGTVGCGRVSKQQVVCVLQRGGAPGGAMSLIGVMPCDADEEVKDPGTVGG